MWLFHEISNDLAEATVTSLAETSGLYPSDLSITVHKRYHDLSSVILSRVMDGKVAKVKLQRVCPEESIPNQESTNHSTVQLLHTKTLSNDR